MKKLLITVLSLSLLSNAQAGHGGAVAGGLFGGLALGSIIATANRPRETVIIQQPAAQQPMYQQRAIAIDKQTGKPIPSDLIDNYKPKNVRYIDSATGQEIGSDNNTNDYTQVYN